MAYTYKPLRARSVIRLINILPNKVDNKVVCILHYFDQAEAPPYHAVSYLWGDPTPVGSIYLGEDPGGIHPHPLHRNLLEFLRCMWKQQMFDKFLWTDSLCLNQRSKFEKSQQVPRMAEIYSNADKVICWLGHEAEKEEKLRIVRGWDRVAEQNTLNMSNNGKEDSLTRNEETSAPIYWWQDKEKVQKWRRVKEAMSDLLLLPYWKRVWIVQEIALSKKALVACSSAFLDLDNFRKKVLEFKLEIEHHSTVWSLCQLQNRKGKIQLWQLMRDFYLCESSLTVDKVYGFLGLVEEREKENWITAGVNYEKTVPEVFWDAIFECRAPRTQYRDLLWKMSAMARESVRPHNHTAKLGKYKKSRWTSNRHVMLAEITSLVFETARSFVEEHGITPTLWNTGIGRVFLETELPNGEHLELQNAAAIGLALLYEMQGGQNQLIWGNRGIFDSRWQWQGVREQVDAEVVTTRGRTTSTRLTTPVPETISRTYLENINGPINFHITAQYFKLVAALDTEHEPTKSWTISLDITAGFSRPVVKTRKRTTKPLSLPFQYSTNLI